MAKKAKTGVKPDKVKAEYINSRKDYKKKYFFGKKKRKKKKKIIRRKI